MSLHKCRLPTWLAAWRLATSTVWRTERIGQGMGRPSPRASVVTGMNLKETWPDRWKHGAVNHGCIRAWAEAEHRNPCRAARGSRTDQEPLWRRGRYDHRRRGASSQAQRLNRESPRQHTWFKSPRKKPNINMR